MVMSLCFVELMKRSVPDRMKRIVELVSGDDSMETEITQSEAHL